MEFKKITQKEYLKLLNDKNKSLCIGTFQDKNDKNKPFKDFENILNIISDIDLKECYENTIFIKLISGYKKRLVSEGLKKIKYYGFLSGAYYILKHKGYNFILNFNCDEDLKTKNFKLYSLNVYFVKGV